MTMPPLYLCNACFLMAGGIDGRFKNEEDSAII